MACMFLPLPEGAVAGTQRGRDTGHGHKWLHNALAQKLVHREGSLHSPGEININFWGKWGKIYLLQRYRELTELRKMGGGMGRTSLKRDKNLDRFRQSRYKEV